MFVHDLQLIVLVVLLELNILPRLARRMFDETNDARVGQFGFEEEGQQIVRGIEVVIGEYGRRQIEHLLSNGLTAVARNMPTIGRS